MLEQISASQIFIPCSFERVRPTQGFGTVDDSLINRQIRNNDLTTFMLKKTWLYSPFAQKKFERTTFRNAKNNRRKLRGELILPSKRVALIRSCPVDHLFEYPRGCQLNRAFFYFPLQAVESEICAKIIPSRNSPRRAVPRTNSPAFGALSGPNSPFSSGLPNWHF